jgi:Fe-S cluster biogenesis protein NfuA
MTTLLTSTSPAVTDAVAELTALLAGDGARLELLDVDSGDVAVRLLLDDADCADCVLPPDRLADVVRARLQQVPGIARVRIDDPRAGAVGVPAQTGPATITVLDPTAGVSAGDPDPGPDAGPLRGRRVGIRVDVLWAAWDATVEEWTAELVKAGAAVSTWRRAQGVKGEEGARRQAEYEAFVDGVDVLVAGLGNCGSCTSWSVQDGLTALERGLPAAVVVTEQFERLGRALAADEGRPGLRLVVLPAFLNTLPDSEVRAAARAAFPGLLDVLGATA